MNEKGDVIVALDFPSQDKTIEFLDLFENQHIFVKLGMEIFYSEGPSIVKKVKERGHSVFLDLKLHDIPNTVEKAMISLAKLDVDIVNVHAAGGIDMMKGALRGLEEGSRNIGREKRPKIIAVTQLTSTDDKTLRKELMIEKDMNKVIIHYAMNAKMSGLDGVVCSPLESSMIHENISDDFITVTPGIRPEGSDMGDQKRVTTPSMARELGSNYIVVGRPVTKADNPVKAYESIRSEFHDK